MPKFQVSYVVGGKIDNRQELLLEHVSDRVSSRDVARAIISHQFPNIGDPFVSDSTLTAEQALDRLGVTFLRTPGINTLDS